MSSARSEAELLSALRELVQDNINSLFGLTGSRLRVENVSLSRPLHQTSDRYHRALTVRCASPSETREKRIWLKFLPDVRALYEIHMAVWNQTRDLCDLFPRPYFYGEWSGGEVIGMELVEGVSLRKLFLRRSLTRSSAALNTVFVALGDALRAFHDSSEPDGFRSIGDLEENARRVAASTEHLTRDERTQALELIRCAAVRAGDSGTALPLIPVHHDCTLRNVVVRGAGLPCLLDLDSMRAPWKSRWFDVAVFLTNLESQIKYAPLVGTGCIAAAWDSFWTGYEGVGLPDGLSLEQAQAVLFLIKLEYVFEGSWLPLFEVYTGLLASRYVRQLKTSVLNGEHLTLGRDATGGA
jgi:hypothetical protein